MSSRSVLLLVLVALAFPASAHAQESGTLGGRVSDNGGNPLPGVFIEARNATSRSTTTTGADGRYRLELPPGSYDVTFSLINFATWRDRGVAVRSGNQTDRDVTLTLSLSADVTVTGRNSFVNLADVAEPESNLVGIAASASQGAITARQFDTRPVMRAGEVLEAVPGVIVSQHSGEGKANQYYLRGFNLDHGTDFSTTAAGMPVNLPTHAHGHGYSDTNFLIPELISGIQYSKGPYFAELGDFSAAGHADINYTNSLAEPLVVLSGGQDGWARALAAVSPQVGDGHLLVAIELNHNDGPWTQPDDYRKANGVVRYSRGDTLNGISLTGMGYRATWNSTDQVPSRAIAMHLIDRFGDIDATDGGKTSRYAAIVDVQRSGSAQSTRASGYVFHYDLDLFSNFTYFLDDPEHGDQFEQADARVVSGGRVAHRRVSAWGTRLVQQTFGAQIRNDDIGTVGLYKTEGRQRRSTVREDQVLQTSGAAYYENQYEWSPRLRTQLGVRGDLYRFRVTSDIAANSGVETEGIVSPKGALVIGPWKNSELYVNAGFGFHSNDARGATISMDPVSGEPTSAVTPLVRATGAEVGIRTVSIPRGQVTASLWTLSLDSELLFVGDAGTTEASRPSHRHGLEVTSYFSPNAWLALDADAALSRARFTDDDPVGRHIPGAVSAVLSAGATVRDWRRFSVGVRLRYFGPRPLVEDDSVRSEATTLLNLESGYQLGRNLRVVADIFNVFNTEASDIDYFYASRLPGEPAAGVDDVHLHPTLPRTARIGLRWHF